MTPERWEKIKALFSSAQDCPAAERDEFLSRACGGDLELRSEIERLLDSYREGDAFMENSAVAEVAGLLSVRGEAGADGGAGGCSAPRFDAGARLNERYEVRRLLGRGGMGEVYLAFDTRLNRDVALKILNSDLVSNKESLRRFALEAQAVSALNHPHIMTMYEFDTTRDGTLFFVAEFVDGQTLNHLIGPGLEIGKALDIAMQVSSALSAAHNAGIAHRDIKPENIMVRRDGYVKVLDFGLAKLTQRETEPQRSGSEDATRALHRTKPGVVMGTPAYMSPEQARGVRVDTRTDIWSLGVVIYEMLTGRRPFVGETSADIIVSVLSNEPPPVSSPENLLPDEAEWVVTKALSKDVEGRYQTSKELRADLERIKKRVEFDDGLRRLAGGESRQDHQQGVPTDRNAARATSGGEGSTSRGAFLSSGLVDALRSVGPGKTMLAVIALAVAVGVSLGAYFLSAPRFSARIDSIAILPFENLSGNPDLTYASDGLSEALIDRIAQLPQLKVISRNSSFRFRGANLDVRDVAAQLGVRAVVTGSVARQGDELSIRIDIVDAAENRHLMGGQYRRKVADLVNLQSEIARTSAEQLRLKLSELQAKRLADNGTEDSEAYRYYLSGLVEVNGPRDVRGRALEYFERAVALDPEFAAAHVEIADIYWSLANGSDDPHELMPKAAAATERALALDPDLAKAHTLQAMVNEYEFDWASAEREYRRAIDLSPNLDFARNNYAFFLSVKGRHDEALSELEQQRLRDPVNRRLGLLQKAIVLTQARRFDEALAAYQEAQAVEPGRDIPNFALAYTYAGKGLYKEAAEYYMKSVEALGGEQKYSQPLVYLAATYAKMPDKGAEARTILRRIEATSRYASPALLAAVYTALGDNDEAMKLLERAYVKRDLLLRFIMTGYEYDGLRGDPRFVDLTKRIGLAP